MSRCLEDGLKRRALGFVEALELPPEADSPCVPGCGGVAGQAFRRLTGDAALVPASWPRSDSLLLGWWVGLPPGPLLSRCVSRLLVLTKAVSPASGPRSVTTDV